MDQNWKAYNAYIEGKRIIPRLHKMVVNYDPPITNSWQELYVFGGAFGESPFQNGFKTNTYIFDSSLDGNEWVCRKSDNSDVMINVPIKQVDTLPSPTDDLFDIVYKVNSTGKYYLVVPGAAKTVRIDSSNVFADEIYTKSAYWPTNWELKYYADDAEFNLPFNLCKMTPEKAPDEAGEFNITLNYGWGEPVEQGEEAKRPNVIACVGTAVEGAPYTWQEVTVFYTDTANKAEAYVETLSTRAVCFHGYDEEKFYIRNSANTATLAAEFTEAEELPTASADYAGKIVNLYGTSAYYIISESQYPDWYQLDEEGFLGKTTFDTGEMIVPVSSTIRLMKDDQVWVDLPVGTIDPSQAPSEPGEFFVGCADPYGNFLTAIYCTAVQNLQKYWVPVLSADYGTYSEATALETLKGKNAGLMASLSDITSMKKYALNGKKDGVMTYGGDSLVTVDSLPAIATANLEKIYRINGTTSDWRVVEAASDVSVSAITYETTPSSTGVAYDNETVDYSNAVLKITLKNNDYATYSCDAESDSSKVCSYNPAHGSKWNILGSTLEAPTMKVTFLDPNKTSGYPSVSQSIDLKIKFVLTMMTSTMTPGTMQPTTNLTYDLNRTQFMNATWEDLINKTLTPELTTFEPTSTTYKYSGFSGNENVSFCLGRTTTVKPVGAVLNYDSREPVITTDSFTMQGTVSSATFLYQVS